MTERVKLRGARPTPRHKLAAAAPHKIRGITPSQVIVVPTFLEAWLNDQYGDCVSAEEAFAKAAYAVMNGLPETKITDTTLMAFCQKYDLLNGANLPPVMDLMASDGFHQDGVTYTDGPYHALDYSDEAVLQNAISIGPVKIGIDANALPSGAGNSNGWYASGGSPGQFNNEDHCTALCGYGPSAALFQALGVAVPTGFPANGYLHYTWGTIGVVDHDWIMSTVGEAWLRSPTTPGVGPTPQPPPPACPPGQHWDMVANACVPDGPTPPPPPPPPPPPQFITINIPPVTIPPLAVSGLFGGHHTQAYTIPGYSIQVPLSGHGPAGSVSITLPPWLLRLLHLACTGVIVLPPPWSILLVALCGLLPPGAAGLVAGSQGATITLPPWLVPLLRFACQFAANLPAPLNQIVAGLCQLLPPQSGPCGCP